MYIDGHHGDGIKRERNGNHKYSGTNEDTGGEYDSGAEPSRFSKRSRPETGVTGPRDDGDDAADSEEDAGPIYVSSAGMVLQRDALSADGIASEIEIIHGMWEMASILDFMHLFRKQLRLQRQFGADELERVIVTSPGDGGLLADVHIVSSRRIL